MNKNSQLESPSKAYKYYMLGILTLVYMFNFVDRQILSVLQEPIRAEFDLSDTQLGLLQGITFALFYVTVGIPIARWADVGNRRNIVSLAVGTWSLMTSLTGFAQNFLQLLLIRIGVGVGEAGGSPPAHSMISDLFKPEQRARALAVYSSGITFGIFLAYVFGGWVSDNYGWRTVFIILGIPGVIIALVVRYTFIEPKRGLHDVDTGSVKPPPVMDVIHFLGSRKSFLHLSMGSALHAFVGYGISAFLVSFYVRTYQIPHDNISQITLPIGFIIGIAGLIGTFGGGYLADRLGLKDKRWYLWVPAISTLLAIPFAYAAFLVDSLKLSMTLYAIPLMLGTMYLGPVIAVAHSLVMPGMRALTSAVLFFILNLIGLGLGPTLLGMTSDLLKPQFGSESLRYAMLIAFIGYAWSASHYFIAAKYLPADLDRSSFELTDSDREASIIYKLIRLAGFGRN
ncbi:MAG: MFS transporter [Gammaproteobacteria bacterium]|nr:MAG: MFS transporter [Gammaproteobacteria bacterium]RLA54065.1 MAG: MFS transporter [Gammaproteobacteria bacterium]